MRNWISVLSFLFLSQAIGAEKIPYKNTEQIKFTKLSKLSMQQRHTIANVRFFPAEPKQGELVRAFVEVKTGFEGGRDIRSFVKFSVSESAKRIQQEGVGLWVSEPFKFIGDGSYAYSADLFIEDTKISEQTRVSLLEVLRDIQKLSLLIERETNPARLSALESERVQKEILKTNYENLLNSLKRPVSTKAGSLEVAGDENAEFPAITSCDPPFGPSAGGNTIAISGRHLDSLSNLTIGGVPATILPGGSATSRQAIIPSSLGAGMHDIEAKTAYQTSTAKRSATQHMLNVRLAPTDVKVKLKNAYYVVDGVVGSSYPVAFAGVPLSANSGQAVALDGSSSYSPDDAQLTFSWTVVSKPSEATMQDGEFSDAAIVNPTFQAFTPGAYVISLVVSNGVKDSVPSLTVVTVGSTDPVLINPSVITGTALADGVYIGTFKACNNLQQSVRYQLFNNSKVVLISGFNRGTIAVGACVQFQFSVNLDGVNPVFVEMPFVVQSPVLFRKMINVNVTVAATSSVDLEHSFPMDQWTGERNLEKISLTSHVQLFGTFDEASNTEVIIRNNSGSAISIANSPVITHLDGSSSVFSTDFPSGGITIPANDEATFNLISSPGSFEASEIATALLEWEVSETEPAKVLMLKTNKFKTPTATSVTDALGSFASGSPLPHKLLSVPSIFFGGNEFGGMSEITSVVLSNNAAGQLSLDLGDFDFPVMIGNVEHVLNYGINLEPKFLNSSVGTHSGQIQIKLKGYQQLFNYNTNVSITTP